MRLMVVLGQISRVLTTVPLYLNPAWLAEFRGFEFVVGANAIKDYRSFERADLVAPDTQSEDGP